MAHPNATYPPSYTQKRIRNLTGYLMALDRFTGPQKAMLLYLVSCVKTRAPCWPAVHQLGRLASCSRRTIHRELRTMPRGWIQIVSRPGSSNLYKPGRRLEDIIRRAGR